MNLNDNTVLITGGTSGIGKALANLFAHNNNKVVICGKTEEKLQNLPRNTTGFCCDLSHREGVENLKKYLIERNISVNLLINNAATLTDWNLASEEDIEAEIYLNLTAPVLLSRFFVGQANLDKENAIVNISSKASLEPVANFITYSVSKRGLSFFSAAIRDELKAKRIKVFNIIPPAVKTKLFDSFHQKQNGMMHRKAYLTADVFALLLANALYEEQEEVNFLSCMNDKF